MENKTFCLRWNQHQEHLLGTLTQLLAKKELIDVTVRCNKKEQSRCFDAHKIVLAACSKFFADLFGKTDECQKSKSLVVLEDVAPSDFECLLQFMYNGQVDIPKDDLDAVLSSAQFLKVRGLIRDLDCDENQQRRRKSMPKIRFLAPPIRDQPHQPLVCHQSLMAATSVAATPSLAPMLPLFLPIHPPPPPPPRPPFLPPATIPMPNPRPLSLPEFSKVPKSYTTQDMTLALECLREGQLSLTRASEMFKIPATTLWQRANKLGIATPKKESTNKTWSDNDLDSALDALRKKEISANKASKLYGIPSSTLYKIARKEGIELAQPFNAVTTSWSQNDLDNALEAIKNGIPVQKAASQYKIPTGTLYGRCKKGGIELSKSSSALWSETDMAKALDSVKSGGMSINQAAIHHNLPYSSLYGRICKLKKEGEDEAFPNSLFL